MKRMYVIFLALLIILSVGSLFIGVSTMTLGEILSGDDEQLMILLASRIPRLISVLITGVGMSISGLIMQQLTRNRFVSPTTAATIDFARLGMLLSIFFFAGATLTQRLLFSFASSLAGTFLFMSIMKRIKFQNTLFIPLIGIMLGNVVNAITMFIALRFDLVQNINTWAQGSFATILRGNFELIYISLPLVIIAFLFAQKFTIAGMGEDFSKNLGVNYTVVVNIGMIIIALISASIVVTVGTIPFIGLIIPNIVSIWLGDNLKHTLSFTAIIGALFLLISDIISRLIIFPHEVTISLTVGIIGSVVFLFLLVRGQAYAK